MVYWDADDRKDLLAGLSDGTVLIFLNVGTDDSPQFDGGTPLQVGEPGSKVILDVGARATPSVVDWNNDGRKDLAVGALDGRVSLYIDEGAGASPDFHTAQFVQQRGTDLVVPSLRASPQVLDLTGDGRKDLLVGNTDGQLLLYNNTGSDLSPSFTDSIHVAANGAPLDLSGTRSRPFVCAWNLDPIPDVLIGCSDGNVHLFQGVASPTGIHGLEPIDPIPMAGTVAAFPNPFHDTVTLTYVVPRAGRVHVFLRDVRGRPVRTLLDTDVQVAGEHRTLWTGRDAYGRRVAPGVYFVSVVTESRTETWKLVHVR